MMNNQPQQYTYNEVSLSEEGSNFRDIYQSRVLETESEYADEMEVDLAEGWQRIVAGIIDWVLWSVFMVPMQLAGVLAILGGAIGGSWQAEDKLLLLGLVLITIAFCIYQIVIMAKDGQSLGKKILRIRVITEDGENPGFVKYVLVRVLLFYLLVAIAPAFLGETVAATVFWVCVIACVIMLFIEGRNRQTLQDLLAKTLVIKN